MSENLTLKNGLKAGDYAWHGDYLYGEVVQIVEILKYPGCTFNVLYKSDPNKPTRLSYGLRFEKLDTATKGLRDVIEKAQYNLNKIESVL